MKLLDLVEELRANILRDTSDAISPDASSYLLSDKSLVRYLNDAQEKFATRTLCLRDETTPDICRLTLVPGQHAYPLDSRVVAVYGATIDGRHIERTTYSALSGDNGVVNAGCRFTRREDGYPQVFYTDRETGRIGFYPAADATYVTQYLDQQIVLRVARLPINPLTAENMKAEPEIPRQWHLDLCEWAAWRALRNHDNDLENLQKASAHKKAFEDVVELLGREAKRLLMQNMQFRVGQNMRG
jgi:hypothetical protein